MTTILDTVPTPTAGVESPTLAELIARSLSATHLVDGHFVRMNATVDGGYITLDFTRIEFLTEADTTVRVLLHLSEPITVAATIDDPESRSGTFNTPKFIG
ncbi:MAG: hypothetical protein ACRDSR_07915 [Pseudonocardiaceae bacterium]